MNYRHKILLVFLSAIAPLTMLAQSNQLKLYGGINALSKNCIQTNWMVNYEGIFKYNLGIGIQAGFHTGIKPERVGALNTDYNTFKHQWTTDVYACYKPLNTQHVVTLGIGYSFSLFTSDDVAPNSPNDYALRRQVDHGILGKVSYEYIFSKGFSLGAFCQYTNYFVYASTQDQLMFGITIGFRF